jgi:hypothetical protein
MAHDSGYRSMEPLVDASYDSSDDEAILFEDVDDFDDGGADSAPVHPIPSMQGPFEESILDTVAQADQTESPHQFSKLNPEERRAKLLEGGSSYNETYNAKWKENDSAMFHPLSKIIAQVAFGIHLLHHGMARSDEEVVKILQRHIDEVDNFVQRTEEDLDMAQADITERIKYLNLPLQHGLTFDKMLEDRKFRHSIVDGNVKIEKIVNRTAHLMKDLLVDISKGTEAINEMAHYLSGIKGSWPRGGSSMGLFDTMVANTNGWMDCFNNLRTKANGLGVSLVKLGNIVNEMGKRASAASRRQVCGSVFSRCYETRL